jgi:hypothetical protein
MKALWRWFDGKKMVIGGACLFLSIELVQGLLWNTWHLDWPWLNYVNDSLLWLGKILVPVGAGHKIVKGTMLGVK